MLLNGILNRAASTLNGGEGVFDGLQWLDSCMQCEAAAAAAAAAAAGDGGKEGGEELLLSAVLRLSCSIKLPLLLLLLSAGSGLQGWVQRAGCRWLLAASAHLLPHALCGPMGGE